MTAPAPAPAESLLFIGAGAGEKNTRRRSKTDRPRNTGIEAKLDKNVDRPRLGRNDTRSIPIASLFHI